jgi:hypothetical protein
LPQEGGLSAAGFGFHEMGIGANRLRLTSFLPQQRAFEARAQSSLLLNACCS